MKHVSRRNFLKAAGIAVTGATLAACGSSKSSSTTGGTSSAGTATSGSEAAPAIVDDLSVTKEINMTSAQQPFVADMNTNAFTEWIEEATNTDITITPIANSEFADKMDILMATGDYPEVCTCAAYNKVDFYGPLEGVIIPLDDYINEELTPRLLEVEEMRPGYLDSMRQLDGKIYSIGRLEETYHLKFPKKIWYYEPMLTETGLDIPTTTDEFYEVLKAVKANGHIPLMGYNENTGKNDFTFYFLANAFLFFTTADFALWNDGGTVKSAVTEDAYREALRYVHKLYAEGLFYNNSFAQTSDQMKAIAENLEDPQVFCVAQMTPGLVYTAPKVAEDNYLYAAQRALTPLKGPDGVQYACTIHPTTPTTSDGSFFITTALDPDLIPRAMRIVDTFCSEEAWRRTYGVEGTDWELSEPGKTGADGVTPAVFNSFTGWNAKDWGARNVSWVNYFPAVQTHEIRMSVEAPADLDIYTAIGSEKLLYDVTVEQYEPYGDHEKVLPNLRYSAEEIDDISRQKTDVLKKIEDSRVAFITGSDDIDDDATWKKYLDDLEKMGLSEIIAQTQMAYERQCL